MTNYRTMKRITKLSILTVFMLGSVACDYLEYDETSYLLKKDVFREMDRSKNFLTGIYAYLSAGFAPVDNAMRSSASDDAIHVWDQSDIQKFNNGSWSAVQTLDNVYSTMYKGIRAVNLFLLETEGQEFEDLKWNIDYEERMSQFRLYPYEARFLRAFFYFELAKRYGTVPLITEILSPEEANGVTQAPFDELVDFIVSECDAVADSLPVSFKELLGGETGRTTRGAAKALKARTLLYAASPLHNTSGETEPWIQAAEAANEIIELMAYDLEGAYDDVCNNHESVELILGKMQDESNSFERNNFPIGFEGGNTGTCPTQNLVDAYEMQETGLPINDPASGFDTNFPFQDRDPRLAATVVVNNSKWKNILIETWYGGAHGQPRLYTTKTGYYLKKYLIESINLSPTNTTKKNHTWILFRYGEVLLNYAEAMNEAYGPEDAAGRTLSARDAVNILRARAEMPEFPAGLSKNDFREKLRNERRVELAFEDHRFWDIRRWKIGESTTNIYGTLIGTNPFGGFVYENTLIEVRFFDDKMNLYPIPQSEIYINDNLIQNTGW